MKSTLRWSSTRGRVVINAPLRQRGVVLLVALILMVAMTLAGIAMMRTIGTGVGIAGNLAFKETATSVADYGVEVARSWLTDPARTVDDLKNDSAANGYYATWGAGFSPLSHNWANSKLVTSNDGSGNEVRYVIHRLCESANKAPNDADQKCATLTVAGETSSKGGPRYGTTLLTTTIQPYFRVTSRVVGPRNTISYVQVVMY